MSNDTPDGNESDAGRPETYQEMFQQFAEVSKDRDLLADETQESLDNLTQGNASEEDIETLVTSVESYFDEVLDGSSSDE